MQISDIRVKLIQDSSDRLKAVCSITLDDEFVVRDLKVVEGTNGLFVAMPSRKLSVHCPQCRSKNHLRARFCNECGAKLPPARLNSENAGRLRMHRDIAHPINPTFREVVQSRVIDKYREEAELAKNPDYVPVDIDAEFEEKVAEVQVPEPEPRHAPSEYDQLIAGLSKGTEAPREREPRPAPSVPRPRNNDRRPDDRAGRGGKGNFQRSGQRGAPRRQEPPRPSRGPGPSSRPPLPSIMDTDVPDEVLDKINGNVKDAEPAPQTRRPTPRRGDDRPPRPRRPEPRPAGRNAPPLPPSPRVTEEEAPAPSRFAEPQRHAEEPAPSRPEPIAAEPPAVVAVPAPRPPAPPPAPVKTPTKNEDLPFGAGL